MARPALHDFISETVRDELRKAIVTADKLGNASWWTQVREVRVLASPSRLNPKHAGLVVVANEPLTPGEKYKWGKLSKTFVGRAKALGIAWGSPLHVTWARMPASRYVATIRLDVPELTRAPDFYL